MQATGIDRERWREHAWSNRFQSLALLGAMAGFLSLLGWLLWGAEGVVVLLGAGIVGLAFSPGVSPRWVMRLYGATRIGSAQAPGLSNVLGGLAERAGMPAPPELYYVPSRMLNAFAVGSPRHSAIAVTDGLLRQLDRRELVGVLAHEISHIRSNDLFVMGLADLFSRATSLLSLVGQFLLLVNLPLVLMSSVSVDWFAILLLLFAPSLSALAQLALSRTREYDADLNAAAMTGDPEGLARALAKLERMQGGWWERVLLPGRRVPDPSLLRTHPPTEERVARLMALKPRGATEELLLGLAGFDVQPGFGARVARPPRWRVSGLWH